ncbi:MAG TPA: RNA polymerase sigma factor [Candidatus Paceibacterota bacterium]
MENNIPSLVEKARNGNRYAFSELYKEYYSPIYRFVLIKTRHKETAEDITQSVFGKALQSVSRYKDTGAPFLAWLYTIARNLCIDYFKKKKDLLPGDPDLFWQELPDSICVSKDGRLEDMREAVARALLVLTDEQREVVSLRFIEDRSYAEIATLLGKSEEALRALNHRAMKEMRKVLPSYNFDD